MKVYVIEQGSYSDYRVVGVFSTREYAEQIAARINAADHYEEATVEEWPLDPGVAELNQGMKKHIVWMRKDGAVERVEAIEEVTGADTFREWERETAPAYLTKGPNVLQASVWATDATHAVKIANERRIQMLALNTWKGK